MALPADFSKIFGATATGGLTPISDVNYSKGWEYVGSNPPTKNDFSYLQNFSDLKAQWLYGYLTTSTNAASRVVGTSLDQIPDMVSFASNKAINGYQKLPGGLIIQWGLSPAIPLGGNGTFNFPIAFPTAAFTMVTTFTQVGDIALDKTYIGQVKTLSSSQATIRNLTAHGNAQYNWIAIGY